MELETLRKIAKLTGGLVCDIGLVSLKRMMPEVNEKSSGFYSYCGDTYFFTGVVGLSPAGIRTITHYAIWHTSVEETKQAFKDIHSLIGDFIQSNC